MSNNQEKLSEESGVSLRTIKNLEKGSNVSLNNYIFVLRVLRILENLDILIPEEKLNPVDVLYLGNKRKRASRRKSEKNLHGNGEMKSDLLKSAEAMKIRKNNALKIIGVVKSSLLKWSEFAENAKLDVKTIDAIKKAFLLFDDI